MSSIQIDTDLGVRYAYVEICGTRKVTIPNLEKLGSSFVDICMTSKPK